MATARANEANQHPVSGPQSAQAATPSGSDITLNRVTEWVFVGGAGNLSVIFAGDSAPVTLTGIAIGIWHRMQIQTVASAGTTATGIIVGF